MVRGEAASTRREVPRIDYKKSPFFLRDSRARETRARVKITPRGVVVARLSLSIHSWNMAKSAIHKLLTKILYGIEKLIYIRFIDKH